MLQYWGFWGSYSSKCQFKGHGVSSGWFACWPVLLLVELHEKISLYLGKRKEQENKYCITIQYTTLWVLSNQLSYFIMLTQDFSFHSLLSKHTELNTMLNYSNSFIKNIWKFLLFFNIQQVSVLDTFYNVQF